MEATTDRGVATRKLRAAMATKIQALQQKNRQVNTFRNENISSLVMRHLKRIMDILTGK